MVIQQAYVIKPFRKMKTLINQVRKAHEQNCTFLIITPHCLANYHGLLVGKSRTFPIEHIGSIQGMPLLLINAK